MPRHPTLAKVIDVQKRRTPSKHYVYVVDVTWSDGSQLVIYRRYSSFYDLHIGLLADFPKAAGQDGGNRIIPYLPGKKLLGRSQTHKVAEARAGLISEYVAALCKLPEKISRCPQITNFFEPTDLDIKPPKIDKSTGKEVTRSKSKSAGDDADTPESVVSDVLLLDKYVAISDYKKQNKGEISFSAGTEFEVVEKSENGWWFVSAEGGLESGWVPATYLDSADDQNEKIEPTKLDKNNKFIAIQKFGATNDDEVGFDKNAVVVVTEKRLDGWWKVEYNGQTGWAPGSFLKKMAVQNYEPVVLGQKQKAAAPAAPLRPEPTVKAPPERRQSVVRKSLVGWEDISSRAKAANATKASSPAPTAASSAMHVTKASFEKTDDQGISFPKGASVEVLDKDADSGWSYIEYNGKEGWAPSDYLEPAKPKSPAKPKPAPAKLAAVKPKPAPSLPPKPKTVSGGGVAAMAAKMAAANVGSRAGPAKPGPPKPAPAGRKPTIAKPGPPKPAPAKPVASAKPRLTTVDGGVAAMAAKMAAANVGGKPPVIGGKTPTVSKAKPPAVPAAPKAKAKPKAGPAKPKPPAVPAASKKKSGPRAKTNYAPETDTEVGFKKGEALEIMETAGEWTFVKNSSGAEGWAPSEYIDTGDSSAPAKPTGPKMWKAKADFTAESDQEMTIKKGDSLYEVEPEADGWICCKKGGKEGWIPSDYLVAFYGL